MCVCVCFFFFLKVFQFEFLFSNVWAVIIQIYKNTDFLICYLSLYTNDSIINHNVIIPFMSIYKKYPTMYNHMSITVSLTIFCPKIDGGVKIVKKRRKNIRRHILYVLNLKVRKAQQKECENLWVGRKFFLLFFIFPKLFILFFSSEACVSKPHWN